MSRLAGTLGSLIVGAVVAVGCGSSGDDSTFGNNNGESGNLVNGDQFGSSSGPGTPGGPPAGCVGLQCKQLSCPGGGTTSLSGKVYDPSGTVPLYNAVVFVPNADLQPFSEGVTCDRCGTTPSGNPIATAITDATGSFTLKNVPVGVDVPLVVQIGRWRRKVTIPGANVAQCADAKLTADQTRLPRNKGEGDIPHIAITTGGADSLECFLRKLGLDDSEFTDPGGAGRIHLFYGVGGSKLDNATPMSQTLWDDLPTMKKYDMVILSCEGNEYNDGVNGVSVKNATARQHIQDYLDAGGRVFSSHFHYTWFKNGTAPLQTTANWGGASLSGNRDLTVDTSFPKGKDFSTWLDTVQATTAPQSSKLAATALRADLTTNPKTGAPPETSRRWLYAAQNTSEETKFFSFNTPIGKPADQQCGRGVFTDIHVSSSGPTADTSGGTFPNNCKTPKPALSPQEKALLFLMMDLASCVQDDTQPPSAPPPAVVN